MDGLVKEEAEDEKYMEMFMSFENRISDLTDREIVGSIWCMSSTGKINGRKGGISRVPIVHEVKVRPTPGRVSILRDGSVVLEVGGIELGQRALDQGQTDDSICSEDLLEKVRAVQADTLSLVQGGFTAGSTTSESSCEAVKTLLQYIG